MDDDRKVARDARPALKFARHDARQLDSGMNRRKRVHDVGGDFQIEGAAKRAIEIGWDFILLEDIDLAHAFRVGAGRRSRAVVRLFVARQVYSQPAKWQLSVLRYKRGDAAARPERI